MTKHFERTDVDWKPAKQIKDGDEIYGPGVHVSRPSTVTRVEHDEDTFHTTMNIRHEDGTHGFYECYSSISIAVRKREIIVEVLGSEPRQRRKKLQELKDIVDRKPDEPA